MKRTISVVSALIVFLVCGSAFAGYFGAPQPTANENGFALGIGYFYSQNKWEPKDNTTGKDFKMIRNEVFVQASGASKFVEGYLRIGGADFKLEEAKGPGDDFKDGSKLFGTVGAKAAFPITKYFAIGPFIQGSLYDSYTDSGIKFQNPWELSLGLALQGTFDRVLVYAGPYLFWSQSKVENDSTWEAKNNIGGVVGARVKVTRNFGIEIEGQYTNAVSAGAFLSWSF